LTEEKAGRDYKKERERIFTCQCNSIKNLIRGVWAPGGYGNSVAALSGNTRHFSNIIVGFSYQLFMTIADSEQTQKVLGTTRKKV
jgi:hypothetical protein